MAGQKSYSYPFNLITLMIFIFFSFIFSFSALGQTQKRLERCFLDSLLNVWKKKAQSEKDAFKSAIRKELPVDEEKEFVATILYNLEEFWQKKWDNSPVGKHQNLYRPKLILVSGEGKSACGSFQSKQGPFYCPVDQNIYLDPHYFKIFEDEYHAQGELARAYIVAHEFAHHIQHELGILNKIEKLKHYYSGNQTIKNLLNQYLELQADCMAGMWAYGAKLDNMIEEGELRGVLQGIRHIGDDKTNPRHPEHWNHGTSNDRLLWFKRGYGQGIFKKCDPAHYLNLEKIIK